MSSNTKSDLKQNNYFFEPPQNIVEHARIKGMANYWTLNHQAHDKPESFWGNLAKEHLVWDKPFTRVLDESQAPFFKWFDDGKLNAAANCLDKHLGTPKEHKTAFIFESDEGLVTRTSYRELYEKVCQLANALTAQGVKKGDRVIIYMPMSVEGVVFMLACARIGAIHSVVFGGFSARSLHERIQDTAAVAVLTANYQKRGGRVLPIKSIVDEALNIPGTESVRFVVVYERTKDETAMLVERDFWLADFVAKHPKESAPTSVGAEHPLFILYTSGSTGKPKGIQHATAGYLLWAKLTMLWTFDLKDEDVYWCTADIGWITGHTYIAYGPLCAGATQVLFEGIPTYPDASRFWRMIEQHQVSIFYTSPTAVRSLLKLNSEKEETHPRHFNLSSLRILGSVGEPINTQTWLWFYQEVGGGRCPLMDTFWQTESGGHLITPLPGATPLVSGSCTLPLPGIEAAIVDEMGDEMPNGEGGLLVIKRPWPSMARTIWGDPERFKRAYFPAELGGTTYLAGDGAIRNKESGYFQITGRIDDVLNVSGHRLGTMEIESALVARSDIVAEAAVVGKSDDITGEAIVAFVVLKGPVPVGEDALRLAQELRNWVGKEISPIAKPKEIRFGENLPKTRSGKIMRRLLRGLARGEIVSQDISTLENPQILEQLSKNN